MYPSGTDRERKKESASRIKESTFGNQEIEGKNFRYFTTTSTR
jgi:hypothetical protein